MEVIEEEMYFTFLSLRKSRAKNAYVLNIVIGYSIEFSKRRERL